MAVIPHFDNAEGGSHDTRYCYLGEERLEVMEAQLPADGWVLGVDEHTACIFDFEAGTATVMGLGSVTIRRHGRSATVPSGKTLAIDELVQLEPMVVTGSLAGSGQSPARRSHGHGRSGGRAADEVAEGSRHSSPRSPLLDEVRRLTAAFDVAAGRARRRGGHRRHPRAGGDAPLLVGGHVPVRRGRHGTGRAPAHGASAWANWPRQAYATRAMSSPRGWSRSWPSGQRPGANNRYADGDRIRHA